MTPDQKNEVDKYINIYGKYPRYHMSGLRATQTQTIFEALPYRSSYLDVGCGRSEMLNYAYEELGYDTVHGTETVPELYSAPDVDFALVTELPYPDKAYDVVSCLDVLEHLLPEDTEKALQELDRVTAKVLLLTANNKTSNSLGVELHINRRPYDVWDDLIRANTTGEVTWIKVPNPVSEFWLIQYD